MKTIGDIITLQRGFDITKKDQSEGIYPVISSSGTNSFHDEFIVNGPGVIIGRKGSLGTAFYSEIDFWPHDTTLWVKDFKGNDPKFIYYLLKKLPLQKLDSGSANPTLNRNFVHKVKIEIPEISIQKKIAKVLSDLDSKIELNNKINAELEGMTKLIYEYWFVQFDFPFDFAQGKPADDSSNPKDVKPYKSSGGKMVWNKELKREIPEGWEVKELGKIADIKAGGDKPRLLSNVKTENCQVPIYSNGVTGEGLYGYTDTPKIYSESITISARGTIGYSVIRIKPFVPIIRLITVTPKNNFELNFLHERTKELEFKDSGSVQKQLTVPQISRLMVVVGHTETIKRFHKISYTGLKTIEKNKEENQQLSSLRDWLWPMLMNGQIKVRDN